MDPTAQRTPSLFAAGIESDNFFDDAFADDGSYQYYYNNNGMGCNVNSNNAYNPKWENAFAAYSQVAAIPYDSHSAAETYPTPPQTGLAETFDGDLFGMYANYEHDLMESEAQLQPQTQHLSMKTLEGKASYALPAPNYGQFSPPDSNSPFGALEAPEDQIQEQVHLKSTQQMPPPTIQTPTAEPVVDPAPKPIKRRRRKKKPPPTPAQEEIRRERLLERNRVAAARCRKKRKNVSNELEEHARDLRVENQNLSQLADSLKEEMLFLKTQMLDHADCGCTHVRTYLDNQASSLALLHSHKPCSKRRSSFLSDTTCDTSMTDDDTHMS